MGRQADGYQQRGANLLIRLVRWAGRGAVRGPISTLNIHISPLRAKA
jgi:hypothetical protein